MTIRDLLTSITTLLRWRIDLWLGYRTLNVSGASADALLKVAARDPDQRIIVETLLDARRRDRP